mgnify:CR=1 FL=1
MIARIRYIFHQKQIGASELSLPMHGRHHDAGQRQRVELLDDVDDVACERALPSAGNDTAIAHVSAGFERRVAAGALSVSVFLGLGANMAVTAASGAWGRQGWTVIQLDVADTATVRGAMMLSWQSVAKKPPGRRSRK